MSIFKYEYQQAADNFRNNPHGRWSGKEERSPHKVYMTERLGGVFLPTVNAPFRIDRAATLFTMGSCFARGLERAAARAGMRALSLRTKRFLGDEVVAGYVNRYNTASILNELRWAAGEVYDERNLIDYGNGKSIDPHSHPVIRSVLPERAMELRRGLTGYFAQIFFAKVITITLGLIEGWFDRETGMMLNLNPIYGRDDPDGRKLVHGDRFEFRVMSHDENMANLEAIYDLFKEKNPSAKLIVSVSPVPLSATFSHRDVAVANTLSKAMLRSCAETLIGRHPEIMYFPSYEMATLSDRALVYEDDAIHIKQTFVDEIMRHFMSSCVEPVMTSPELNP
jgi:hypothetical protein